MTFSPCHLVQIDNMEHMNLVYGMLRLSIGSVMQEHPIEVTGHH